MDDLAVEAGMFVNLKTQFGDVWTEVESTFGDWCYVRVYHPYSKRALNLIDKDKIRQCVRELPADARIVQCLEGRFCNPLSREPNWPPPARIWQHNSSDPKVT